MPRLPIVPRGKLPSSLNDTIEQGLDTGVLSTAVPIQVWSHRPDVAQSWLETLLALNQSALLSARERELARLRVSAITQCQACQLARKSDQVTEEDIACLRADDERFTPREQLAIRFAETFAHDHTALDDEMYQSLGAQFSDPEIAELHLFCGLMLAGGRVTYALQAYEASS
ncbi:carboxymuconolactone decarboxylase family protein [Halioxenophilus aromaticivorans]|uniref:carboxymuconolactone decarboxylase family protein n=1 Tax=Halioxenophilus aromaticivorans TaxID=1306992 RepID=UPI0031F193E5